MKVHYFLAGFSSCLVIITSISIYNDVKQKESKIIPTDHAFDCSLSIDRKYRILYNGNYYAVKWDDSMYLAKKSILGETYHIGIESWVTQEACFKDSCEAKEIAIEHFKEWSNHQKRYSGFKPL